MNNSMADRLLYSITSMKNKSNFQELFAGQPKAELPSHTDQCQASFAQKTTINVTSTSLLPTLRGARSPPWPRPTGRRCELLAVLTQCDGILSHSDPHCIGAKHALLIIYKDPTNTFHFPKENFRMMKTKNNSPSISRDRHALSSPPYPSEDQLDGLRHKFPTLRQIQIQVSKLLLSLRDSSPSPPVWF